MEMKLKIKRNGKNWYICFFEDLKNIYVERFIDINSMINFINYHWIIIKSIINVWISNNEIEKIKQLTTNN